MSEGIPQESFDIEKSPMREAYVLLGATDPQDLHMRYVAAEQPLFKDHTWDYDNPDQIQNKIKDILEKVDKNELSEFEAERRKRILWFWYHHACSVADGRRDKEKEKYVTEKAMEYEDSSNILTRTMYLLCHDKMEEAEKWVSENPNSPDIDIAEEILANYKKISWFWPLE